MKDGTGKSSNGARLLMGYLDIAGVDEDGMPLFIATPLGLAEKPRELERMRV